MIEQLIKNVDTEINILREISSLTARVESSSEEEKMFILKTADSLTSSIKTINRSIPDILNSINLEEKAPINLKGLEKVEFQKNGINMTAVVKAEEKEKFLAQLNINEGLLKRIRKEKVREQEKTIEFKEARGYLKLSNKFFLDSAQNLVKKGYYTKIIDEIKKANLDILSESYIATMLFSTLLAFFAGIFMAIFFIFFNIGITFPFVSANSGSYLSRFLIVVWLPIAVPLATYVILYYYPTAEKNAISKRIDDELPFAVVHMSSISGAGLEPTEIFKIIGLSKEYPYLRKEIRKVLNQINIYGYDLVTALNNASKGTSNARLSELFAGLSTTMSTGGSMSEFFQKRSETLMVSYRLEKEKFVKVAETFLEIYISIVIAAPMILMLLLVMISVSGLQTSFSPYELTLMIIAGVALINIIFLGFLQIKKTTY